MTDTPTLITERELLIQTAQALVRLMERSYYGQSTPWAEVTAMSDAIAALRARESAP